MRYDSLPPVPDGRLTAAELGTLPDAAATSRPMEVITGAAHVGPPATLHIRIRNQSQGIAR